MRASEQRAQRGSTIPLIVGFTVVLLIAAAVVIDATAAWLQRQSLDNIADGAALHAADLGAQGTEVYADGLDTRLHLDPSTARSAVDEFLDATGARGRYPGLTFAVTVDADRLRVTVRAPLDLPIAFPGAPTSPPVSGSGGAFVTVDDS
ncbi:pilus assembly protein TadG-related protein [Nocardioides sp. Kera G14]|uniref:pilus assembly protein TadG-related protein n=1 Tax=Nocardioides sp. Kera G14 TaxID=2884264 RepID=UPI001D107894|nr:pilus assembly protein TadG-related protein [Nocardioides sp. Kera G14]UDY22807.1 Tad domain-containing protein [Nocardioides sp. Kera G14]